MAITSLSLLGLPGKPGFYSPKRISSKTPKFQITFVIDINKRILLLNDKTNVFVRQDVINIF